MNLGLKKDEVRLVQYTSEWNIEFNRVKREIVESLRIEEVRIEHIGSTAIKGMSAKPILDMIVGVDDIENVDEAIFSELKKLGFLRLRVARPHEIVLAKFTDATYEVKTHYIHLVDFQQDLWNNLIFFRDYLNSHEEVKDQYEEIKSTYVKKTGTGIKEYTESKEEFVKNIFKMRHH